MTHTALPTAGCILFNAVVKFFTWLVSGNAFSAMKADATFRRSSGDVIGVVAPLRGVAQVGLHGDQVVELSVLLGVHQEGGVEEDGEGQVEVEREEGEVKERRSWMACGWDEDSRTP